MNLLDGATDPDNDALSVRSVDGTAYGDGAPAEFPAVVSIGSGEIHVRADGSVVYDDLGDAAPHPADGVSEEVATFTFTVWDGELESAPAVATVRLTGSVDTCATDGILAAGFCPVHDAGTEGTFFVSATSGDDGNLGTLDAPFETIQRAVDAAGPGDVIRVRNIDGGGVYRETVDASGVSGSAGARITIAGYGTEKPVLSGADIASGFAPCTAADEALLGPNFGNIYKTTVPRPNFTADGNLPLPVGSALNIVEDGTSLELVHRQRLDPREKTDGAGRSIPFHMPMDVTEYESTPTSNTTVDGGGRLRTLTDPIFGEYSSAQLQRAILRHDYPPTESICVAISSAAGDTVTIETPFAAPPADRVQFALSNILPEFREGQWGYVDDGVGDITLYVWPFDERSLEAGIEYSTRTQGVIASGSAYLGIENLEIRQQSGLQYLTDGRAIDTRVGTGTIGLRLTNVRCSGYDMCTLANRGSVLALHGCTDTRLDKVEVTRSRHHIALNMGNCSGVRVHRFKAYHVGASGHRALGNVDATLIWADFYNCGFGSHGNVGNNYGVSGATSGPFWMHGVRTRWSRGYFPIKSTANVYITCCDFAGTAMHPDALSFVDSRALSLENDSWALPADSLVWLVNSRLVPDPRKPDGDTLSITAGGGSGHQADLVIVNNVIHGGGVQVAADIVEEDFNLYTRGMGVGPNNLVEDLDAAYVDAGSMDYAIVDSSVLNSAGGRDLTGTMGLLEALEADFSAEEVAQYLGKDLFGDALDLSAPPVGPAADRAKLG